MIPPRADAAFACARENVPGVYARPHDPRRPVGCPDAGGNQRVGEARPPRPVRPRSPGEEDYEYARHGVGNLLVALDPRAGVRRFEVTERETTADFARLLKRISDDWYPAAARVAPVGDDLSTHQPAVRPEASDPAEARRLMGRLGFVSPPEHGSGLNGAGIELSVPARPCLGRRIPDPAALKGEVAAWQGGREAAAVGVDRPFTTADARTKLKRLYPVLEPADSGVAEH